MQSYYAHEIAKTSRTLGMDPEGNQLSVTEGKEYVHLRSPAHLVRNGNVQPRQSKQSSSSKNNLATVNSRGIVKSNVVGHPSVHNNSVILKPPRIHRRNKKQQKIPYYLRLSKLAQRKIIQKPWSRPLAALHLSAIKIQGAIRRYLYKNKQTLKLNIQRQLLEERRNLQGQINLMQIQAQNFQQYQSRGGASLGLRNTSPGKQAPFTWDYMDEMKYQQLLQQLAQVNHLLQQQQLQRQVQMIQKRALKGQGEGLRDSGNTFNQSVSEQGAHLTATQKFRQKFLTSPFNVITMNEERCLRNFCAALIQATYKMSLTRRLFKYHRFAMYHIAAMQIQWGWRGYLESKKKVQLKTKDQLAAEKIQKAWRSYTNVRIFKYYKDLINFRAKGNPYELLRCINRGEAHLLDSASRCHVRFRLGGLKFPPLIYYKIFIHGGVVDIGSFAPRDYCKMKKEKKKATLNLKFDKDEKDDHQGWYERIENNGWRPINDKMLTPFDQIEQQTAEKKKPFHFDPAKRRALTQQEKRLRQVRWLRKLYRDAKNAELVQEQSKSNSGNVEINFRMARELEKLYDNPFDDQNLLDLNAEQFDEEVNNLIEWCEDLDYEKYTQNWHEIATSNEPEVPRTVIVDQPYKITSQSLGEFTFENQQILALQKELAAEGVSMHVPSQINQNIIDQNLAAIQREQLGQQQIQFNHKLQGFDLQIQGQNKVFMQQIEKQEKFIKSNLDYENRLRGHMYQFDEADQQNNKQSPGMRTNHSSAMISPQKR